MATTFIRLEHFNRFNTLEEATREADTLRMNIKRFAQKYKIPCSAMIGISVTNLKDAEVIKVKKGRARPARKIVSKTKRGGEPEIIPPHLHIVIACNSKHTLLANYLMTKIYKRCQKTFPEVECGDFVYDEEEVCGENYYGHYYRIIDPLYYIKYVIRQSIAIRYVDDYTGEIEFDFKAQQRAIQKVVEGTYFHKKMRKNYLSPVELYEKKQMSKTMCNCSKDSYLKDDSKTNMLCRGPISQPADESSFLRNADGSFQVWI